MQRSDGLDEAPEIQDHGPVHVNKAQRISRVTANFGNHVKEYFVVDSGRRVGVVLEHQGSLLLVRQYRLQINRLSWEIPGGRVEEGETPEEGAIRECLEETGLRCKELRPLISYQQGLDTVRNPTDLFYTSSFVELDEDRGLRRYDEVSDAGWVPLLRCMEMIRQGQIVDSFSIIAIQSYWLYVANKATG